LDSTLTGDELLELLHILEDVPFALAGCSAVELSFQAEHAEELITVGAGYLGDRLSSKGPLYRSPNDAWIHIDFTPNWNRTILFENAIRRLKPNGKFIIVTQPEHTVAPDALSLVAIDNQVMQLSGQRQVRIYLWQTRSEA
jgi:hypothetical protein